MSQTNLTMSNLNFLARLKKNIFGVLTILLVAIFCYFIVKIYKKPGQMSVLESQAMDMTAMIPPVGAVPVSIASVQKKLIQGSLTYTGTAQAFEDEDIYPRVTGKIVYLKVYPGDRVKKNELIVKLDPQTSEYKANLEEAMYESQAESHNVDIAKNQLKEKEYEYKAALEDEASAQQLLVEAQAGQEYWIPEKQRQKKLYEAEVVSLSEYQLEESYCKAAMAKTLAAQKKFNAAINKRKAAQSAYDSMEHHVNHQYLLAKKAQAKELKAQIYDDYTSIHIKDDAVVTKRLISPGVLVNPGMLILKVAYINKLRIQIEVSEEDSLKIKIGNPVLIKNSASSAKVIKGYVTSIFPAADPNLRTFIVEALIDNVNPDNLTNKHIKTLKDYFFLPGQYVITQIITGESLGLAVPTHSIIYNEGKSMVWQVRSKSNLSALKQYTCLMHPEIILDKPGSCPKCSMQLEAVKSTGPKTAYLVQVKTGLTNPNFTEITSGLNNGDEVITAGFDNLIQGSPVVETEWSNNEPVSLPSPSDVNGSRLSSANNWAFEEIQDDYKIKIFMLPKILKSDNNEIGVIISKLNNEMIPGAKISIDTSMPGMNMSGPRLNGITNIKGEAKMTANLSSGDWQIKLKITLNNHIPLETTLAIEVP